MNKTMRKIAICTLFLLVTVAVSQIIRSETLAFSPILKINLTTSKPVYDLGEYVFITGELMINRSGSYEPVSDGLVAIQVNDPNSNLFAIRTRPTGSNDGHLSMEILDVTPCGAGFNPKYSFQRGEYVGFNVTVRNNDLNEHYGIITVCSCYEDETPFATKKMWNGTVQGGKTRSIAVYPVMQIPENAPLVDATAYVSLLTEFPENGGFAYCPEKTAPFTITSRGGSASSSNTPPSYPTSTEGTFDLTFQISGYGGVLGDYTTYACSLYEMWLAMNQTTFETILIGDLNNDKVVDISDISFVARHFGTLAGDPDFDPLADIAPYPYGDGVVDISDIAFVARRFGKYGT